ncbi:hypothetical protein M2R49_14025 [Citrobacter amalonaticus]|uniref:hypothetical protein n=1 Tax=Citrobacter amalonaticus TaxID=35703 RepID=UPI0021E293BB|nr:hypothetical protein [Citrobacter amalonaticus]UYF53938.1 hypothetical protein M2R49_14025 [Citrobacter amalonaticus]
MTTITKERVAEIIHAAGLEPCDYEEVFGSIKTGEIVAMARIALASLTAEPVAYVIQDRYERQNDDPGHLSRSHVTKYVSDDDIQEHEITCTPLYSALPAPVVPEEKCDDDGNTTSEFDHGWNACRAAMLQGAEHVSNRDELPPDEIECDICGHVSTDPEGRHHCCEDNSND